MPELIHTSRRIFLDTENASITLSDGESTFRFGGNGFTADLESADADQIHFTLRSPLHPQPVRAVLRFAGDGCPELRLSASGPMNHPFEYPGALVPERGDLALIPAGEGFAFPVDDPSIPVLPESAWLCSQSWHMALLASLRGDAWIALAPEEGADATIRHERRDGLLFTHLCWQPQLGEWGYERAVRFLCGTTGGLNALCRTYRTFRESLGEVIPLREKRRALPHLDSLIGAANFWIWPDRYESFMYGSDEHAELQVAAEEILRIAEELKESGCGKR